MQTNKTAIIRGGGDLASAIIQKLHRSGFKVIISELKSPQMVRRTVSFSSAVYEKRYTVEGITAALASSTGEIEDVFARGEIPILTGMEKEIMKDIKPDIFIDATLSKKTPDYKKDYADIVIGLGPEIVAGIHADVVIETSRGHDLGRLIFSGKAKENSHIPGNIAGFTHERVIHSPVDGEITLMCEIGDIVEEGHVLAKVGKSEVKAKIPGMVRGLIHDSIHVTKGLKIADVDPRGKDANHLTISDKGRNIAGGVLEAVLICM